MDNTNFEILINKWNPHFQDVEKGEWVGTIPREHYLTAIFETMNIRHVTVLSGVRRSGKSTIIKQLIQKLIEKGNNPQNLLFLQLEDVLISPMLDRGWQLLEDIYKYYLEKYNPKGRVYLFLDEIQGISDFNKWINSYYERKYDIKFVISGSRQSLLESESATILTGRTVKFDIYPFSFSEYLQIKGVFPQKTEGISKTLDLNFDQSSQILHHLGNYLIEGGFPEIVLEQNQRNKELIANSYYNDILVRDIIKPNSIRNALDIENLGLQVLSDFTKTHTYRSLGKPQRIVAETVKQYLNYFYQSYLFFESSYFSHKVKETHDIQKPKKLFVIDNGVRNFNILNLRKDWGQCVENIVYLELKKNHRAVYYWKGNNEIDFVVVDPRQEKNIQLFNVNYTDDASEREILGLLEGMEKFQVNEAMLLTKNLHKSETIGNKVIHFIPLWVWLIMGN
ncbi:MAG: ATP-binding protein [bacterium]